MMSKKSNRVAIGFLLLLGAGLGLGCPPEARPPRTGRALYPSRRAVPPRRSQVRPAVSEAPGLAAAPVDTWKAYFRVLRGDKAVGRAYLGFERNDEGERYETRQAVRTAWGLVTRKVVMQVDEQGKPSWLRVLKMEQVAGSQIRVFTRYVVKPVAGGAEIATTQFGYRWRRQVKAPGSLWGAGSPLLLAYYVARRLSGAERTSGRSLGVLDVESGKVLPLQFSRRGTGAAVRIRLSLAGRGALQVQFDARWAKLRGLTGQGRLPSYRLGGKPPAVVPPPRGFDRVTEVKPFEWPADLTDQAVVSGAAGRERPRLQVRKTYPKAAGKLPAVILVPAADTRDLDGTRGMRAFYKELAALLGRAGFMVYRYAPRGVGQGSAERSRVTLADWMADLATVVRMVRRDRRVRRQRIFLLGHGEGGILALRYAVRRAGWLRGLLLISTPGVEYSAYILDRWRRRWETAGMAVQVVNRRLEWFRKQLHRAAKGQRTEFLGRPGGVIAGLLKIDPLKAYGSIRLRTLILAGQADITVREDDVNALRAAMPRNRQITVVRPADVGHLLQHSRRFLELAEMWKIPAPIAQAASRPLLAWLKRWAR